MNIITQKTNTNNGSGTISSIIHINDIIKRDGAAGKLFRDIGAVHDDGASIEEIQELEKELAELEAKQPDYQYISIMKEWIEEARESAEDWDTYEAIRADTIANTGDEDLADDVAWELVFGG